MPSPSILQFTQQQCFLPFASADNKSRPSLMHLSLIHYAQSFRLEKPTQTLHSPCFLRVNEEYTPQRLIIIIMNSFVEANEQTVVDFNSIVPKMREHPKPYAFFIYYLKTQAHPNSTHLQKLSFKLREEKSWNWEKQENGRLVQMFFVDLQNQLEYQQSFFDLKMQLIESLKTKLIFYSKESHLLDTLNRAQSFGIDVSNSPAALYSPPMLDDLAQHLGWREDQMGDLSIQSSQEFETSVKKWMSSPGQKMDLWNAIITVDSEGSILKLDPSSNSFHPVSEKTIKQYFLTTLAVGHHSELLANYELRKKEGGIPIVNKAIFNIQSLKKFCCIGKPTLETSTGVVSVIFQDDKGNTQEITKQMRNSEGKKGIMTLLLSNIDRFQGMRLAGGKINDSKLQVGVLQSSSSWRLISSSSGELTLRFGAAEVFVQVNSSCFKLLSPKWIKVVFDRKIKVLINKDTLEC